MTKEKEDTMQTEKNHEMEQSVVTRFLIAGGAIGSLLFMIVLLIEGATRPGYSAWHNYGAVSVLVIRDGCRSPTSLSVDCSHSVLLLGSGKSFKRDEVLSG